MNEFLTRYMEYVSEFCDAPKVMQAYSALSVLSTMCIQKTGAVCFTFGEQRIYPNLWILLVAPSSIYRKTTILGVAESFTRKSAPQKAIFPNEFSPEGFWKQLVEHQTGIIYWGEISNALNNFKKEYMLGTIELLTDLYDNKRMVERRLSGGLMSVENPRLNILAASTMEWLSDSVSANTLLGGFLARFVICMYEKKTCFFARPPAGDPVKHDWIMRKLNTLRGLLTYGKKDVIMTLSEEAGSLYDKWAYDMEIRQRFAEHKDPRKIGVFSAFASRMGIAAIKIACLLQAVENLGAPISRDNMRVSLGIINHTFKRLDGVLFEQVLSTPWEKKKLTLEKKLREDKHVRKRDLLRYAHISNKDFEIIINTMVDEQKVTVLGNLITWRG